MSNNNFTKLLNNINKNGSNKSNRQDTNSNNLNINKLVKNIGLNLNVSENKKLNIIQRNADKPNRPNRSNNRPSRSNNNKSNSNNIQKELKRIMNTVDRLDKSKKPIRADLLKRDLMKVSDLLEKEKMAEKSNIPENTKEKIEEKVLENITNIRKDIEENVPIDQKPNSLSEFDLVNINRENNKRDNQPNRRDNQPNRRDNQPNRRDNQPNRRDNQPNRRNNQPNRRNNKNLLSPLVSLADKPQNN